MAKAKQTVKKRRNLVNEADSEYFLKILFYLVIGSFWLRITNSSGTQIPIPIGFIAGVALAMHERLRIDRKLEYAVLLMAMFIGFWLPIGITITH
ncbi:MAG TPA: hypothetical protein VLF90_03310 [Patescibacteria group bacterium]|nr:hypothetical protein [Patescibacteria group bacterium]